MIATDLENVEEPHFLEGDRALSRIFGVVRLLAMLLCLVVMIGVPGCTGASDPTPVADYDDIKSDPELYAIATSGKRPKQIRDEIKATIRSRQQAADAKPDTRKKQKR